MNLGGANMYSRPSLTFVTGYRSVLGECRCYGFGLRDENGNPGDLERREAYPKYQYGRYRIQTLWCSGVVGL